MAFEKREYRVLSSDGIHYLYGVIYIPEGEARGFFHIAHGMTEHIFRYDRIMTDLCEKGYICFGYDHLGHGKTVNDKSELGFIAHKKGYDLLCRDIKVFSDAVRGEFDSEGRLPYFLLGHSMGSFIVRLATEKYVRPDRLVIMGTGGANPAAGAGIALISLIKLFKGERYISKFIYDIAFGGYNTKFKNDKDANSKSWLTTSQEIRNKYLEDDYCTFKFTVNAMGDLMKLLKYSNRGAWYKNMPKIPVLLVAGADDPVGNYGKGVREVETKLKKCGHDAKCILYKGARHEILNDFCYEEVKGDILEFIGYMNKYDFFWKTMELCDWDKEGDDSLVLKPVIKYLSSMEDADIFEFEDLMSELLFALDTKQLADQCKNVDACFSDDGFLYSRCVALINGKDYYKNAKQGKLVEIWGMEFESLLYVAQEAWALKHKKDASEYPHISSVSYETGSNLEGWK